MKTDLASLPRLQRRVAPARAGIVHIGPGAFFRAFTAIFTDDVLMAEGGDWGIVAVSLQSTSARDALKTQGGCYTAVSLDAQKSHRRVVNAVVDVLVAPENPAAIINQLAHPDIKLVTLTVTEKGYCHVPATGRLQQDHPQVVADLAQEAPPASLPGILVSALAARRSAGLRPFTVLSCDNLPEKGKTARRIVLDFARLYDRDLAGWIESEGRFPCSMVDRITPATTEEDIHQLADETGYVDHACVQHEPFRQWVIEDAFVDGARPSWERVGAQLVTDVSAHEAMKLRCLNGTHSALAYLGYLAGFTTIAETVENPAFRRFCMYLWKDEILPTVVEPEGQDLAAYTASLMTRYQNPSIRHRTWQIAMDGSQKLPQRILGTISDRLKAGRNPEGLCLVVAAWMRYVGGIDDADQPIDVRDPMAARLRSVSDAENHPEARVAALLDVTEVFDPELAALPEFRESVARSYTALAKQGALRTVEAFVARCSTDLS